MLKGVIFRSSCLVKKALEKTATDTNYSLRAYRYGSWLITSLFYLMGPPNSSLPFKMGVVVSLFIAIKPVLRLYEGAKDSRLGIFKLVTIETVGIAFLLVPTGGLQSPFIWYALSPVLVAASFLPVCLSWFNLGTYLVISGVISAYKLGIQTETIKQVFAEHSSNIMVFLLLTLAFQLQARLVTCLINQAGRLEQQKEALTCTNKKLVEANRVTQEYLEHISTLYSSLEAFCSHDDMEELVEVIVRYSSVLTGGLKTAFGLWEENKTSLAKDCFKVSKSVDHGTGQMIYSLMDSLKDSIRPNLYSPSRVSAGNIGGLPQELVCVPVCTGSRCYGILAALTDGVRDREQNVAVERRLAFLAKLSAISLERTRLEKIADNLLLTEEQNRIADEIHDTVSQRLFSISYALYKLSSECNEASREELKNQLKFVQKSANKAAQELRESIYRLSSKKNDKISFLCSIGAYLDEMARLNNIETFFEVNGSDDLLSSGTRMALYRVISEAAGNAIRHGNCSTVRVKLDILPTTAVLIISDNGSGFDPPSEIVKSKGLGLKNMERVVKAVNGVFYLSSSATEGTIITCKVPLELNASLDTWGGKVESCFN